MADAVRGLSRFGWDRDVESVVVTSAHVVGVLGRYLAGALSAEDVELWAEALAGRDDVGFVEGTEDELKQVLFELSTPEINWPIGPAMASGWITRLQVRP
ncbi:hypothetical protein [Saccharothrix violaceirubra]|uniref:Uncharacterized protein n=1 Tax=Saccharothrix violaceirubra TaxID=413306 RepID=A0A7W7SYU8_9PSEU|nr:hypothetical protein [Saccharothrix violaceirubra]MBB4963474.1 hypothetical protein [Saccharothrix violaceirubra]